MGRWEIYIGIYLYPRSGIPARGVEYSVYNGNSYVSREWRTFKSSGATFQHQLFYNRRREHTVFCVVPTYTVFMRCEWNVSVIIVITDSCVWLLYTLDLAWRFKWYQVTVWSRSFEVRLSLRNILSCDERRAI